MADAIFRRQLISDDYLEEQRRLHADPRGYGTKGRKWAVLADQIGQHYGANSILDYGCGQGSLGASLTLMGWTVAEYDPAIPGKDDPPEPADLLLCTDVLEHIEPDRVDAVLDHLAALAKVGLLVVISLVETAKMLSDGRQAHISLHPPEWWAERLQRHFRIVEILHISPQKQWVAVLMKDQAR